MLDESLLDAPDALARADRRGLLRGAAEAGARVRTALRHTDEAGIAALTPEGRPRSIMVAGSGAAAASVADLIGGLVGTAAPVTRLRPTGVAPAAGALRWALPGWTGTVDLLLIVTIGGDEPGLALLAEQAYRRGCTVVAVAPLASPLAETVDGVRGLLVPMAVTPGQEFGSHRYGERPAEGRDATDASKSPSDPERTGGRGAAPDSGTEPGGHEQPGGDKDRGGDGERTGNGGGPTGGWAGDGDLDTSVDDLERAFSRSSVHGNHAEPGLEPEIMAASPGALWSLLTPLLVLLGRIGLVEASADTLQRLADRLDHVAERCGPAVATYSNPAKTLAAELAESLPLIWTEGESAAPTGRRFATVLAELAGMPALAAELPEALPAHSALLRSPFGGGADPEDFFRDRVEDPQTVRARVVLLRDRPAGGLSAAPAAREAALGHDTPISELEPGEGSQLEALAELVAVTDFAAVYLALASTDSV
jgi:Bacterial phospho-glucose isomerase C-terminal SIS domain